MDQMSTNIPPFQLQSLIDSIYNADDTSVPPIMISCVQALGTEVYIGCSNGELLRFALQELEATGSSIETYQVLSRQWVANRKNVDEIVLAPSISRAFVLSDRHLSFYTLPTLDLVPIQPIRNVAAFAIDEQQLRHAQPGDPIDFSVLKRTSISLYGLKDKLIYQRDMPFPSRATLARRSGWHICVADQENYNIIDLKTSSLFPILPLSQASDSVPVKPFILVVAENEFLILSWTGASTLGLFVTADGDPVRGTLQWETHPKAVTLQFPFVFTLMQDDSIEVHSIETQTLVQSVPAMVARNDFPLLDRKALFLSGSGFSVPTTQRLTKLRPTPVKLLRTGCAVDSHNQSTNQDLDVDGMDDL